MKSSVRVLVLLGSLAVVSVLPAPPARAQTTTCSGAIVDSTIVGDVVVRGRGSACSLLGTTVTGSVIVQSFGRVSVVNSTVQGNLVATQPGAVSVISSTIEGDVYVNGTSLELERLGIVICGSTVRGNVVVQNINAPIGAIIIAPVCDPLSTNVIAGSVVLRNNVTRSTPVFLRTLRVENNQIGGSLICFANTPAPTNIGNTIGEVATGQCAPTAGTA